MTLTEQQPSNIYYWDHAVSAVYIWPNGVEKQVRPISVQVNDYIPVMDSNSQDWFTASGSNTLWGTDEAWLAFHPSVEWGTDYTWHSPSIWNKQWVYTQIHMPDSIIVNWITIWARKNWSWWSQNARPIYWFKLEWSNDWTNRTEIHSETALSWTRWEVKDWTITGQTTAYTWLKLNVQSTNRYVAFDFWNVNGLVK